MAGTIERIHIGDVKGEPVRSLESVDAVAGKGLAGDRNFERMGTWNDGKPGRDLTLIEAEAVEALARDHGIELAPGESRRNLTTRGVRLNQLVGKDFWIGGVLARGVRLCEPCDYLQELVGKPILKPLAHHAGLRADLLTSGRIVVGDRVVVKD